MRAFLRGLIPGLIVVSLAGYLWGVHEIVSVETVGTTTSSSTAPSSSTSTSSTSTTQPPTTTTTQPTTTTRAPRATPTTVAASSGAGSTTVSWYGDESGSHSANGAAYDPAGLTFAHRRLAYGTKVQFCGSRGCVVATCTDRGPAEWTGRDFDLSRGSFSRVADTELGVVRVTWEVV